MTTTEYEKQKREARPLARISLSKHCLPTKTIGWIEVGYDLDSSRSSFIIALDPGGMVWEGRDKYQSLDEPFRDLEKGLRPWMREVGIEPGSE
jgi:hypothetical protein